MRADRGKKRNVGRTFELTRRFAPYFKPYVGILALDLFCAALTSVCEIALPLIARYVTDAGMNDPASLTVTRIVQIGTLYLTLRLIDTLAYYYQMNQGHVMGARIETDLRRELFGHLQELSLGYYDNAKVGQLMSRITTDLNEVTEFAHHCPEEFFVAAIKIGVSFGILMSVDALLTLVVYAAIPLMILSLSRFNRKMRESFRASRAQLGDLNAQVEDSLLGIRVVKAFGNEGIEEEKFERGNGGFLRIKRAMYKWMSWFHATVRLFDGLMYLLVLVLGALSMRLGRITPADLVAYLMYVAMLLSSVRRVVEFTEQFQRGVTGLERFFEVMDEEVAIHDTPGAKPIEHVRGDITFEDVSFSYDGSSGNVLTGINLHMSAGQTVALVGPSGGGKTTLTNLIPRLYEATGGRILLDGVDTKNITLKSLRANIGMVQQDVYLFAGSIRDNIEYGRPGASQADVVRAARMAGAHEFIEQLSDGYDTFVGERGVKLSGGQKQRVAIARVFLKNPPVLILDEATSALDNESELLVQRSLEALMAGRTTFTIAHRLTTIRNADRILVLTERGIEEQGTREELLNLDGLYASLERAYGVLDRVE
ncbi:MAG: ABC transporter ATP-binding protein [Eubacteriales bacterium]|nr:ABC transporter ATP-binding protein [Christensenellaceae bacterium]MEA5067298.1 ABC transporter ATP-binding protein [Eubacteriales bacterium]